MRNLYLNLITPICNSQQIGFLPAPKYMNFIFFPESSLKKFLKSKFSEFLGDQFWSLQFRAKNFQRSSLSIQNLLRESFLKAFSPKLQIPKLNIKSTSGPKILKIFIWDALYTHRPNVIIFMKYVINMIILSSIFQHIIKS